jgi:thymidylate synthase ThyX
MAPFIKESDGITQSVEMAVRLAEYDPDGETKVIAAMLYEAPRAHRTWEEMYNDVSKMSGEEKKKIVDAYLKGRTQRWQKIGRAFEHAVSLFEIEMNIGGWRDLHRHRMLTHQRQFYSCIHGYDTPPEVLHAGLAEEFSNALERAAAIFKKMEKQNPHLAQYAVPLAYRVRFLQRENLRQSFWQIELRTGPQGHPDYRHVAQEKYRLLCKAYPLLGSYILADMNEYDFARRETEARIEKKKKELGV